MVDQQSGTTKSSVPAFAQSRSGADPSIPRPPLSRMQKASCGAAILLAIGLVIGLLVWGVDPDPYNFLAAASLNDSTVQLDSISCLAIAPHQVVYDEKDYSDPELPEAIVNILSIKKVLSDGADYATCPWGFGIDVVPKTEPAVRYNGRFAKYLVSIGICERTFDGRMNPNKCLSKNIYVFNPRVAPHDLFLIALDGLARRQTYKFESFQRKKPK